MNILKKIKKEWDFKKSTQENVLIFNQGQQDIKRKNIFTAICIGLVGFIVTSIFHHNAVFLPFLVGGISYGSTTIFYNSSTYAAKGNMCMLDSTHFVVAWSQYSSGGFSKLGTISGTSISYGASASFGNGNNSFVNLGMLTSTTFVLNYTDGSGCYSRIGSYSGTTISYGSDYTITLSSGNYSSMSVLDSTHFCVGFNHSNGFYYVVVASLSGTVVTYGTPVLDTASIMYNSNLSIVGLDSSHFVTISSNAGFLNLYSVVTITATYVNQVAISTSGNIFQQFIKMDSTHFVMLYSDVSENGACVLVTLSGGNTLSLGTASIFLTGTVANSAICMLDSTHFAVAYKDTNNSNNGTAVVATISGTSISYSTPVVFNTSASTNISVAGTDSSDFVVTYEDAGNSNFGNSIYGTITASSIPNKIYKSNQAVNRASTY
jgi:hypothetical protein